MTGLPAVNLIIIVFYIMHQMKYNWWMQSVLIENILKRTQH